jgi:hypothetical protein
MVTIPNTLKNKANEKIRKFLRKYSLLLKKLHPNLAASYRKENIQIEGNWAKQFRLVLEQYVRNEEAENWQDFIQLVIDLKFHDLYKQIEKAELICYKEEIKPPKKQKTNFNQQENILSLLLTKFLHCSSIEEKDEVRKEMHRALFSIFQDLKTMREIVPSLEQYSNLVELKMSINRISKMASRNSDELIYLIQNEIKRISSVTNPIKTPIPSNPSQNIHFKTGKPGSVGDYSNGFDNDIVSRRKDVTTEPIRRGPGLREQTRDEAVIYEVPSSDSTLGFYSEEPGIRTSTASPERNQWTRVEREFYASLQDRQSLTWPGNDAVGLEPSQGIPDETKD